MDANIKRNIKLGTIISYATMAVSLILHFFYTPFMLEKVGDDNYGIYSFATSFIPYLTLILGSLAGAYNKYAAIKKSDGEKLDKMNGLFQVSFLILGGITLLIISTITILLATGVFTLSAYTFEKQRLITIIFFISSIQTILLIISRVFVLHINYNNKFILLRTTTSFVTLFSSVLCIPFLIAGKGVITISIVNLTVNFLSFVVFTIYDLFVLKIKFDFSKVFADKNLLRQIMSFSGIILLTELSLALNNNIDKIVLGFFGYDTVVTRYTLALTIIGYIQALSSNINLSFVPKVYDNYSSGKLEENKKYFYSLSNIHSLIWSTILGGFLCCGKTFITLWLGTGRQEVYWITLCLIFINLLPNTQGICSDMERAANKHINRCAIVLGSTLVNLGLTILFVWLFGYEYALHACLLSTFISKTFGETIILSVYNFKVLKINFLEYLKNVAAFLIIGLLSGALAFAFNYILNGRIPNILLLLATGILFLGVFALLNFITNKNQTLKIYSLIKKH